MLKLDIDPNKLYTVGEIACILRLSEKTVYKLLKQGTIAGKKIGLEWRVMGKNLLSAIEN